VDGLVQHIANGDSLSLRENLLGIVRQLQFSNPIELTFWNQRDINAVGSHGATLLMTAASCDNTDAINILWTRRDLHLNVADGQRNTALHHASERNCTAAARCLLKLGANPNILNERGYSPLHTAIISKQASHSLY
jgi:ankyrin repeat protein